MFFWLIIFEISIIASGNVTNMTDTFPLLPLFGLTRGQRLNTAQINIYLGLQQFLTLHHLLLLYRPG